MSSRTARATTSGGSAGTHHTTTQAGTTRARLVGSRTGVLADSVVAVVQVARAVAAGSSRVASRLGSVVSPLGWVVAVVIPAALISGYLLGWVELVVAGWAAAVLGIVALVFLVGHPPFRVHLDLPRRTAVVGDGARASVTIANTSRRRALGAILEVPVGETLTELAVPNLRRGAEVTLEIEIPTERRGVVTVGPVRSVRADPLGLARREIGWSDAIEIVVHPRTVSVSSASTGLIRDLEGSTTRELTSSDVAFHALREYQSGDDRRYIHWRSTAKTGTYMVRQFEQTRRSNLLVAQSLATHDFADDAEFELAVSVTASLGVRAIRDGRTVAVVVSALTPEFAKRRVYAVRDLATHIPTRLLDELAVVAAAEGALPLRDIARVVADSRRGVSVAFLVTGSRTTTAELRASAARFPADVHVVAIVCDPASVPGMSRLAGVDVLTIGFLDELRLALARAEALA